MKIKSSVSCSAHRVCPDVTMAASPFSASTVVPLCSFMMALLLLSSVPPSVRCQTECSKFQENPVIGPAPAGSWEIESHSPCVLYDEDAGIYRMWYAGYEGDGHTSIGYAWSRDGIEWKRHESPVVARDQAGPVSDCFVDKPWVIRRPNNGAPVYEMWLSASSATVQCGEVYILRAVTDHPEGIENWEISEEPVLRGGPAFWERGHVAAGAVLFDATAPAGKKYRMWYQGFDGNAVQIGLAESEDGIDWKKHDLNPILRPELPELDVMAPAVLLRGNFLEMWYTTWRGGADHLSYATSFDGVHWMKSAANPVLSPSVGSWDGHSVFHASVIVHDQPRILEGEPLIYKLWYTGRPELLSDWQIGYAEAPMTVPHVPVSFLRGDCNDDGKVNISDAVFTLGSLFLGEGDPGCEDACDSNDDGAVDISDAIATLGVLFLGNGIIPLPGMTECGGDPTDDELICETTACP